MASITSQADLKRGLIPLPAESFATSKGEVSNKGLHIPDLDMVDAKNVMPTTGGYTSFFGQDAKVSATQGPEFLQRPITYRTYAGHTIVIGFARDGLYLKALAGDGVPTVTEVTADVTIELANEISMRWTKVFSTAPTGVWENWTWAIIRNKIYLFQRGMNVILRLDGDEYGKIILTKLNPTYVIGTGQASEIVIHAQEIYDTTTGISDTYKSFDYQINAASLGVFRLDMQGYGNIAANPQLWEGAIADSGLFNVSTSIISQDTEMSIQGILDIDKVGEATNYAISCDDPNAEIELIANTGDPTLYQVQGEVLPSYNIQSELVWSTLTNWLNSLYNANQAAYGFDRDTMPFRLTISINGIAESHDINLGVMDGFDEYSRKPLVLFFQKFNGLILREHQSYTAPNFYVSDSKAYFKYYINADVIDPTLTVSGSNLTDHPKIDTWVWTDLSTGLTYTHPEGFVFSFISDFVLDLDAGVSYDNHYMISVADEHLGEGYGFGNLSEFRFTLNTTTVSVTPAQATSLGLNTVGDLVHYLYQQMYLANWDFYVLKTDGSVLTNWTKDTPSGVGVYYTKGTKPANVYFDLGFNGYIGGIPLTILSFATEKDFFVSYANTGGYIDRKYLTIRKETSFGTDIQYGHLPGITIISKKPPILADGMYTNYHIYRTDTLATVQTFSVWDNQDILQRLQAVWDTYDWTVLDGTAQITYDITITYPHFNATDTIGVVLAQSGSSLWSADTPAYVPLALPQVEGIFSARDRLGAWTNDNRIHTSSASDATDFTPSKTTQANEVSVNSIKGNIAFVQGFENGFVIYATGNVVIAKYTGQQFVYDYEALKDASGVIDPRHVTGDLSKQFYWSNNGLYSIDPKTSKLDQLAPELTDWVNRHRFPIYLNLISNRFLCISLQDTPDTYSYRRQREATAPSLVELGVISQPYTAETSVDLPLLLFGRNLYPTFQRTLVFDTLLGKWGSCDVEHKMLYSLNPINQQGFPIEKDYFLSDTRLANYLRGIAIADENKYHWLCNDQPADSYCVFGKYATHKYKMTKLVEAFAEFVNLPESTKLQVERVIEDEQIEDITTSSTITSPLHKEKLNLGGRWFNILVRGTRYHLKRLMTRGYNYGR